LNILLNKTYHKLLTEFCWVKAARIISFIPTTPRYSTQGGDSTW